MRFTRSRRLYSSESVLVDHLLILLLAHSLERTHGVFFKLIAYPTSPSSYNDLIEKEVFLRRLPPSFDYDFVGDKRRRSPNIDED
jgi:hypothetical protein